MTAAEPSPSSARHAPRGRIGALARLPVFFDLAGRRIVVVGAVPGAAWKAELLAAAGGDVTIWCDEEPCAEILALAGEGRVGLRRDKWTSGSLEGAAFAVGAFESEDEAAAFAAAARAAGALVNTIDMPASCDFTFGSIVERSPLVVGISTDGAAPILGQAVRLAVDAALPPWLGAWAELGRGLRDAVKHELQPGPERRRFWEALSRRAFAAPPGPDAGAELRALIAESRAPEATPGRLTQIRIGCADAECLTLGALRALQGADLLLVDAAVHPAIAALARREAARLLVGGGPADGGVAPETARARLRETIAAGRHVVTLSTPAGPRLLDPPERAALAASGVALRDF